MERFRNDFEQVDMSKYFNLSPELKVQHTLQENVLQLRIKYVKQEPCPRLDLPIELWTVVQSYLFDRIQLYLEVLYPREYPFLPPVWNLLEVEHNLGDIHKEWSGINTLSYYYKDKVNEHNQEYRDIWSPAISIVNDVLDFIRRINHFDEIVHVR
jgi:hypothetical protein